MKRRALAVLLSLAALHAAAQVPVLAGKSWGSLNAQQKIVLTPLESQWRQMDASSRDTWAALALSYPSMDPQAQKRLQERMRDWAALTPAERQRVHAGFAAAQRVAPEQRQQKWEQYQALTPEKRLALQERAAQRKPAEVSSPAAVAASTSPRLPPGDRLDARTLLPRRPPP